MFLRFIHSYIAGITWLNHWFFRIAAVLMAIVVPSMMAEVISRYFFHAPTVWGMELAVLLFGPYFLLGGPYLLHLGGHVNMDLLHTRLPPGVRRGVDVFNQLVILFFCATLIYYALPLAIQSFEYRETTFSAWNPPLWPFKFTVPLAMLLMAMQSLAELARVILGEHEMEDA